jgi:hypothetical protein
MRANQAQALGGPCAVTGREQNHWFENTARQWHRYSIAFQARHGAGWFNGPRGSLQPREAKKSSGQAAEDKQYAPSPEH